MQLKIFRLWIFKFGKTEGRGIGAGLTVVDDAAKPLASDRRTGSGHHQLSPVNKGTTRFSRPKRWPDRHSGQEQFGKFLMIS
jgi:hypothetical protein